jgi:16S rRNA (adenine1518-N6/adenine1519-N6)-dimethyltransferase
MGDENRPGVLSRLRAAGLLPRKALGQHFLHDPKLLASLAQDAGVGPRDRVLEIGTGPGTLTRELALRAESVLSVDIDTAMLDFAARELKDFQNITFLPLDAVEKGQRKGLRVRESLMRALEPLGPFLWVSNLPYGIATPLIVLFCESSLPWSRALLLVQAEVAERMSASAGEKAYGPVSALVAYWAKARAGRKIPPGAFWPPPKVNSRVLHLERSAPLGAPEEYEAYRAWVKRLFSSRRKQLQRLLRDTLGPSSARRLIEAHGWSPSTRPENLAPRDFLLLAREFPAFRSPKTGET